ncbi:alpha/beta hydrolase [Streptomyces phaeolivaceus]|uniref:Alpha/beta hydrolase n=1 Tax=Streptomyces phaeolivaceus TaxID=2653200 RepID=A0A5P8KHM7_9ACTN|nr:alpha/beta fold hydrolase [Streptomyces phaeolivaceus]QFR02040.1 alpha/beta hydrolase [Streptomyces phaeolivaceus]
MTGPADTRPREVRRITLDAAGLPLSALLGEPPGGPARAVVVAVHGGGMNAGYFDCRAHPQQSLLTLGASLGYTVLAVDRPGYRHSAAGLPEGQELAEQAVSLRAALRDFTARHDTGAGLFLLAHSYGGKVALTAAADDPGVPNLLGLDISGCGHLYAVEPHELPTDPHDGGRLRRSWGPLRLYPSGTFRESGTIVEPVPALERAELARWPQLFRTTAPRVRVPVRLTFAEHEAWWRHDEEALTDLAAHFTAAPRVSVDRQPAAGHNISLGWAARSYHLRALAFLEDCLTAHETTLTPRAARPRPSAAVS